MNAVADFPIFDVRTNYETIELELVRDLRTLFSWMMPKGRACFSPQMVQEISKWESLLETHQGNVFDGTTQVRLDYVVFASRAQGVFNLGGDLELFVSSILRRDRKAIEHYAKTCLACAYRRHTGFDSGLTTIALVQGKAMGGGFESALACDFIISERSATFALPEVLFNLFPGMGAMSFLTRKVGLKKAEEICLSGETYSAREMHALGVIDEVVDDGEGVIATREFIARRSRHAKAQRAIAKSRPLVNPITRAELEGVVDVWTDCAMNLDSKDLRMMGRLVRAQERLSALDREDEAGQVANEPFALAVNA